MDGSCSRDLRSLFACLPNGGHFRKRQPWYALEVCWALRPVHPPNKTRLSNTTRSFRLFNVTSNPVFLRMCSFVFSFFPAQNTPDGGLRCLRRVETKERTVSDQGEDGKRPRRGRTGNKPLFRAHKQNVTIVWGGRGCTIKFEKLEGKMRTDGDSLEMTHQTENIRRQLEEFFLLRRVALLSPLALKNNRIRRALICRLVVV